MVASGEQHNDYDGVFNWTGSTLAAPHFGPQNGVHLNISPRDCEAYFVRNGQRPDGVKDLLAEKLWVPGATTSQVEGAPSRVPGFEVAPVTAVAIQCTEGHRPSIQPVN
jgi:hypothetical protein